MLLYSLIAIYDIIIVSCAIASIFFNLLAAILQLSGGTTTDDKLNRKGWIAAIFTAIGACSIILVTIISPAKEEEQRRLDSIEQSKRDSLIRLEYQQATEQIIVNQAEGFAKYGFKYDSATQSLERIIRDSANAPEKIISETAPSISIQPGDGVIAKEITDTSTTLLIKVSCFDAPAKDVNIVVHIFTYSFESQVLSFNKKEELSNGMDLSKNYITVSNIKLNGKFEKDPSFYVYCKSDYFNLEGTKSYSTYSCYHIVGARGKMYIPSKETVRAIEALIKRMN